MAEGLSAGVDGSVGALPLLDASGCAASAAGESESFLAAAFFAGAFLAGAFFAAAFLAGAFFTGSGSSGCCSRIRPSLFALRRTPSA